VEVLGLRLERILEVMPRLARLDDRGLHARRAYFRTCPFSATRGTRAIAGAVASTPAAT
jgi:hypothetical protein